VLSGDVSAHLIDEISHVTAFKFKKMNRQATSMECVCVRLIGYSKEDIKEKMLCCLELKTYTFKEYIFSSLEELTENKRLQ
jgi:hypothetical protein